MGAAGQVAANHTVAGVVVEGFLASARVDPGATSEVGLGRVRPGVALGGECPLRIDASALVLVVGPVAL